jgi:ribosomal-protein-alanine N-acetyltransferase
MKEFLIKGDGVVLRPFKMADAHALFSHASSPEVRKYLPFMSDIANVESAHAWINTSRRLFRQNKGVYLGIEKIDTRELIGSMNLKNINLADRNAEVEYWLEKRFRHKGFASESLLLLLDQAFTELDLVRVYAIVHARNTASIRLLERFGFLREGTWRKASFMNNVWSDVYGYGLLKEEFQISSYNHAR